MIDFYIFYETHDRLDICKVIDHAKSLFCSFLESMNGRLLHIL